MFLFICTFFFFCACYSFINHTAGVVGGGGVAVVIRKKGKKKCMENPRIFHKTDSTGSLTRSGSRFYVFFFCRKKHCLFGVSWGG